MSAPEALHATFSKIQRLALSIGVICLALSIALGFRNGAQFFQSYLYSFIYWLAFPSGCLALLMLHHLTGGKWGYPMRRLWEAGSRTYPLMALLFIPILIPVWKSMSAVFPWTDFNPDDKVLLAKHFYLNSNFFTLRAVIYFAIWIGLAALFNKWSAEQDKSGDPRLAKNMEGLAGPGIILWGIALTYASIDWGMSLEPHWFSTIYGMIFMIVGCLLAMAFGLFVLRQLADEDPVKDAVSPAQFNDLGNLLFAFTMLWAYLNFDQFLIIWSGNIKDEIPWYMTRAFGPWGAVAAFLLVMHFFVPFLLLLQRPIKRRLHTLSMVAAYMILLSIVDVYWLIMPSFHKDHPNLNILDLLALAGIGGLWLASYFRQLSKMPLLPQHDPRFEGVLLNEHGD